MGLVLPPERLDVHRLLPDEVRGEAVDQWLSREACLRERGGRLAPADGTGLAGKSVVVTGAGGGIGRAVASAFAAAGARVCAADVNGAAVQALVAELGGSPHIAETVDLRELANHEPLLRSANDAFGRFDVLANAAAVLIRRADVDEVSEE